MILNTSLKNNYLPLLLIVMSVAGYLLFGYSLARFEFLKLLTLYTGLFFCVWRIIEYSNFNFWVLAGVGVLFRLLFLVAIPNLSQDFYRFLWDGRVLLQGVNPYLFTPEIHIQELEIATENSLGFLSFEIAQATELHAGMGDLNASHYSNYPPVNQLCFAIAALFAGKSILGSAMVLRVLIILADVGILYFGKKLLERLQLPIKNIFWYFLNPFIIIELTANLHFEGVMLLFVVWSLYVLHQGKWFWAAVLLGISVSVKLLPLLLLPLFFGFGNIKPTERAFWTFKNLSSITLFYLVTLGTVVFIFAPFLSSEFISNFTTTIGLWFGNFEFNASVYYVIRWIGFQTVGWNIIGTAGKIMPLITILFLVILALFRTNKNTQQLITGMLLGVSFYLLLSTTVHPWYVATPLILSVFTRYKFPIVWSFMVVLSYAAYGATEFSENLWLVAVEYVAVIGFAVWEIKRVLSENTSTAID